jgi:hypothetical protein
MCSVRSCWVRLVKESSGYFTICQVMSCYVRIIQVVQVMTFLQVK